MKSSIRVSAILLFAAPLLASAHVNLESSTPAKGSTIQASPEKVILVFGEEVELKGLSVQKVGDKAVTKLAPMPTEASDQFTAPLPKLADGDYVISYRFIGLDQHDMTATIPFKVSAAAKKDATH